MRLRKVILQLDATHDMSGPHVAAVANSGRLSWAAPQVMQTWRSGTASPDHALDRLICRAGHAKCTSFAPEGSLTDP